MDSLGSFALLLAFAFCLYSIAAALIGEWKQKPLLQQSAERAALAVGGLVVVATFCLLASEGPTGLQVFLPPDGGGLNPLLQHPAMVAHPPMLYLGFVGFTIPFAFAFSALISRAKGEQWIHITRRC